MISFVSVMYTTSNLNNFSCYIYDESVKFPQSKWEFDFTSKIQAQQDFSKNIRYTDL